MQEPNMLELWEKKPAFEEKNTEIIYHV